MQRPSGSSMAGAGGTVKAPLWLRQSEQGESGGQVFREVSGHTAKGLCIDFCKDFAFYVSEMRIPQGFEKKREECLT